MPTDDWGGVAVQDDWGGVPVDQKDDWGGVAVVTPQQVNDAGLAVVGASTGPGSLVYANAARDSFNQDQPERDFFTDRSAPVDESISTNIGDPPALTPQKWSELKLNPSGLLDVFRDWEAQLMTDKTGVVTPSAAKHEPLVTLPSPENPGITQSLSNFASQLSAPDNLALMATVGGAPAALQKAASIGFAAHMGSALPEQIRAIGEAAPGQERAGKITDAVLTSAMTLLAGLHGTTGRQGRLPTKTTGPTELPSNPEYLKKNPDLQSPTVVSETVEGLILAREKLGERFFDQPPQIQKSRRESVQEIDDQLRLMPAEVVRAAEETIVQRGLSKPQASEQLEGTPQENYSQIPDSRLDRVNAELLESQKERAGEPLPSTGSSKLWEEAQRETTEPVTKEPKTVEDRQVEADARIQAMKQRIQNETGDTMMADAFEKQANASVETAIKNGKEISWSKIDQWGRSAVIKDRKGAAESLDAPVREGESSLLERTAAEELTPSQEAARNDLISEANRALSKTLSPRDAEIVLAAQDAGRSMEQIGKEIGAKYGEEISKQRVSQIIKEALPKLRKALEERGVESGYVGGPGAMGPIEALEMKLKSTGTKNEVVRAERELRGEEPILKEESIANQEHIDKARETLSKDPSRADVIVEELNSSAKDVREISIENEAILVARKMDLMRERTEQEAIYGSGDVTPEQRAVAARELDVIESKMNDLDQATFASGSVWGSFGNLRSKLIKQDYSIENMESRARKQKGEALTTEERQKIKEQSDRIQELTTELEKAQAGLKEKKATKAIDNAVQQMQKQAEAPFAPRVMALAESIVARLDKAADAARKRITERLKNASAGLDPVVVYDVAVIGTSKLARASLDFAKWSAEMTADLGDWVKPYLADAWKEADKIWKAEERQFNPKDKPEIQRVRKAKAETTDQAQSISSTISERAKAGDKPEDLRALVQKLALNFVKAGEKTRDGLIDKVHQRLVKDFPDIQKNQTRDLISGYGDFKALDKDAAKTTLRELKGEMQQIGKLEDMEAKRAPKKTGVERRSPSDEERRLIKAVNEKKKEGGFEVLDPEKQLKTSLDSIKTRLNNEIRDMDTAIASKERITPRKNVIEYDAEAKALKERRDIKKAEYDALFPKEPLTDAQMIDRAGKALDRSISELESDLKSGKLYGEKNTRRLTTPELEAKRARLEALRAQRNELRSRDTATIEARQLAAYKTRTTNRIAEIQEKIANQDFAPKVKKEVKLDNEALDLKAKIEEVKEKYNEDLLKHKLAQRTMGQKIIGGVSETINTARAILTSLDFSAVLRQGGFVAFGNPVRAARALPDMFRAALSPHAQKRINAEISMRDNAKSGLYDKAKLYLADTGAKTLSKMEEDYLGRWSKKIPLVAGSERAYTTFLNKIRADTFDAMVKSLGSKEGVSLDEAKAIANFVNIATGRGGLGKFETSGNFLSTVFFSPRYVASRFQLLSGSPAWGGTLRTRAAVAKEYAKFLTGIGIVYGLGQLAGGEIETDSRSSDFGKLKFGKTRIDLMGGLLQNTVLLSRIATGETKTKGGIVPLRGPNVPFKGDDVYDVITRFTRQKFSPLIGAATDLVTGKNAMGEAVTPAQVAKNLVIPMSMKDVYENMTKQGVPPATAQFILSIFGVGVQNYDR